MTLVAKVVRRLFTSRRIIAMLTSDGLITASGTSYISRVTITVSVISMEQHLRQAPSLASSAYTWRHRILSSMTLCSTQFASQSKGFRHPGYMAIF